MTLVDALYINTSGGLELLKFLVNRLENVAADVLYLFDSRCVNEFLEVESKRKLFLQASLKSRVSFYKENSAKFDIILCFANIPPPIPVHGIVYTLFHNVNLLLRPKELGFKTRCLNYLKSRYIGCMKKNTNYWVVQTGNSKNTLSNILLIDGEKILTIPFYEIENMRDKKQIRRTGKSGYVYVANYTKAKNHMLLLHAWEMLFDMGYNLPLHLTLSDFPEELEEEIDRCKKKGLMVVNHGYIPKNDIWELYLTNKAIVYPSVNESFGLGIVEALSIGCDVIGPNLPYINSICIPSETFDLKDINTIVSAIIKYESGNSCRSRLLVNNEIDKLVSMLI